MTNYIAKDLVGIGLKYCLKLQQHGYLDRNIKLKENWDLITDFSNGDIIEFRELSCPYWMAMDRPNFVRSRDYYRSRPRIIGCDVEAFTLLGDSKYFWVSMEGGICMYDNGDDNLKMSDNLRGYGNCFDYQEEASRAIDLIREVLYLARLYDTDTIKLLPKGGSKILYGSLKSPAPGSYKRVAKRSSYYTIVANGAGLKVSKVKEMLNAENEEDWACYNYFTDKEFATRVCDKVKEIFELIKEGANPKNIKILMK